MEERATSRVPWGFLVLTFLLSWPLWVVSGVLPRGGPGPFDIHWFVAQCGVLGPALAALIVSASLRRDLLGNNLRILPVVLLPLIFPGLLIVSASPSRIVDLPQAPAVALVVVALLVALFFSPLNRHLRGLVGGDAPRHPGGWWIFLSATALPALFLLAWMMTRPPLEAGVLQGGPARSAWILAVLFAHNVVLGGALGEEIGWRGYLLPRLLERMNPVSASVLIGVVWGLWHLPIDIYARGDTIGVAGAWAVLARVVYAIPISVLFTWFYLRAKRNLLVPILLHASINVMGELELPHFNAAILGFFALVAALAWTLSMFSPTLRGDPATSSAATEGHGPST